MSTTNRFLLEDVKYRWFVVVVIKMEAIWLWCEEEENQSGT